MFTIILLIFFIPICLLLILIVLLQAGKGGGLSGAFGGAGGQTFLGTRGAAGFLSKFTVYLAIGFMTLVLVLSLTYGRERKISIKEEKTPAAVETTTETPAEEAAGTQGKAATGQTTGQTQSPSTSEGSKAPSTTGQGQATGNK